MGQLAVEGLFTSAVVGAATALFDVVVGAIDPRLRRGVGATDEPPRG